MALRYLRLETGCLLPSPAREFAPFKAVVIVEMKVEAQWQAQVSRWLAESGCRYMMAWGVDCESWDSTVDEANLEQFGYSEMPDDEFIVTTWHEDEPLADVVWFAKVSAHHPTIEIENVLLMHIATTDRRVEFEQLYDSV